MADTKGGSSSQSHSVLSASGSCSSESDIVLRGRIVVFSIVGCPYCKKSKTRLEELNLPYHEINLDVYPEMRAEMIERAGGKTSVPQIFFNSQHLGGWDDFQAAERAGLFQDFLDEVLDHVPPMDSPQPPKMPDVDTQSSKAFAVDEWYDLVLDIRGSGLIGDHRYHLRNYKNTFVGSELVDWLVANKNLSRRQAVEHGHQLLQRKFAHHVTDEHAFKDGFFYYRLVEDDESVALNSKYPSELEPQPAAKFASSLRRSILNLYGSYLSDDGKSVDYTAMGQSETFDLFVRLSAELQRTDITNLTRNETLAFFINIYNALVVHGTVEFGPPASVWQRYKFFNKVTYNIGGNLYSLQDIENGVLRGNRKGVGQLRPPFGKNDPRLPVALARCEPKIHFALVCGAKSCPAIKTYTAEGVEEELRLAAMSFLDSDSVLVQGDNVSISRILKWYGVDFGANRHEILAFILDHLPKQSEKRALLAPLLKSRSYTVDYQNYDWSLNGV